MSSVKKQVVTGLTALTLLEISADMTAAQNWQGGYVGQHVGYRWGNANHTAPSYTFPDNNFGTFTSVARSERQTPAGVVGGAFAGFNTLPTPNLLVGVEADVSAGRHGDSTTSRFVSTDGVVAQRNSRVTLNWQSTLRARVGYVSGHWLAYVTGGGAVTDVKWEETITTSLATLRAGASDTRWGGDR